MLGVSSDSGSRNRSLWSENMGRNTFYWMRNVCFLLFGVVFLIFTIIAVENNPNDTSHQPFSRITNFLKPTSRATSNSDNENGILKTGVVDFSVSNRSDSLVAARNGSVNCEDKLREPIDCGDPEVFLLLMRGAMNSFKDIEFYRFGKPVQGNDDSSCHMAWRSKPIGQKGADFLKDYRSFELVRTENCTINLVGIGDRYSGENAGKRKKNVRVEANPIALPVDGESSSDAIPDVGLDEHSFSVGKYLFYSGGVDRCKNMHQYLWSFLCMLGEARYLNRTLVMDLSLCLSKIYTSSGQDEEGKDFRFYFDYEHLMDSASVLDQTEFWLKWDKWQTKNGLTLHNVEDHVNVKPMKLVEVNDSLIVRKFVTKEPNNCWFQVCEGEANSVIDRPWSMIWKSRPLLDVALAIVARMKWDFDAVRVERGMLPKSMVDTLKDKIDDGREVYIATNERNTSFLDVVRTKFTTHFIEEHEDLWGVESDLYAEMTKLNKGRPVEFDGFMRQSVDLEVFSRGGRHIDMSEYCKDDMNKCRPAN